MERYQSRSFGAKIFDGYNFQFPDEPLLAMTDQALEAIKLTSKEDKELLYLVRRWVEERKADLEDYEPSCVLISRLVKCFRTNERVGSTTYDGKKSSTSSLQQHSTMKRNNEATSESSPDQIDLERVINSLDSTNVDQRKHSSSNHSEETITKIGAKKEGIRNIESSKTTIHVVEPDNLFLLLNDFAHYLSFVQQHPLGINEDDDEGESTLTVADVAT